jgi:hypothetical protein
VVCLVDETDGGQTHPGAQGVGEIRTILPLDKDAARGRTLQEAGSVKQGRLPRAGRPDEADDLALPEIQLHPVQDVE